MATTDTPWCGQASGGNLYLQSGKFTSTMLTSIVGSSVGITTDGTDTWQALGGVLFITSGQFSSTVLDSEDVSSVEANVRDLSYDGNDCPYVGDSGNKMYLQSGAFTSTLKTSLTHPNSQPSGISSNTDQDTPSSGFFPDILYIHSGQFTSTIKANISVSGDPQAISWDGTDTLWAKSSGADYLYLQSGAFTSTVKDSLDVSAIETTPSGICTNDFVARSGVFLGEVFPVTEALSLSVETPTIDLISNIVVIPTTLALGIAQEDTAHVNSNVARPWPIAMGLFLADPVVEFGIDHPAVELAGALNAWAPTIAIITQTVVSPDTLALTAVFIEGIATPDYFWVDQALPLMTLNARIYNGFTGTTALPMLTLSANCVVGFLTYTTQTLPLLTLNVQMGKKASLSLPVFTLVASGTTSNGAKLTKPLPLFTLIASGKSTNSISLIQPLPMFTLDAVIVVGGVHSFASNLPMFTLDGRGINGGAAAVLNENLPLVTLSSSGYSDGNGTLSKSLPLLVLDAFGTSYINRII